MSLIMTILSSLTSLYMLILMARIILTWFSGNIRIPEFLSRITDPYLNWFRRFGLRIGHLDLSAVLALTTLSIVNQIFATIARFGVISLGIILFMILQAIWSVVSFLLIFIFIVIVLRLIAYLCNLDIYSVFWRIVDTISQPILYRINRLLFKGRIVNFRTSIILSAVALTLIYLILRILVTLLSGFLIRLPV